MRSPIFFLTILCLFLISQEGLAKRSQGKAASDPRYFKQTTRSDIVLRQQNRERLKAIRADASKRKELTARQATASCSPHPTCGTDYQPTVNSYALFPLLDLWHDDIENSVESDLQTCAASGQALGSVGAVTYIPHGASDSNAGKCYRKGTELSSGTWRNKTTTSTLLFGSCCDYNGIVPSDVLSSCCQTRSCNPTSYPTCNSTFNAGSGYAVFPNWDPYYGDLGDCSIETSRAACSSRCDDSNTCAGYYFSNGSGCNCYLKTGSASDFTWEMYHDTVSTGVFYGSCCDFAGVAPDNVMASCCQGS
ncbi:hypothetical protein BCR39DRAFT_544018 [Naematelia encephala]|uniref:Apple domain-containing protein n=1 Tax=Naematelia encephala TaxID=71784 RepID=A0A1Y2ASX0_9TREE|nr:hypothetical protein BCR39DRAFT_544018 [Naematelia encephala]